MTTGLATSVGEGRTLPKTDRRRHQRVAVNILGRFMLEDRHEYPCQVIDMSPGGMAVISPVQGRVGERIVAYLDHISRVEGRISRHIEGGFAIELRNTPRKREKLAAILTWLANRDALNLPEDRRYERFVPKNPMTKVVLENGTEQVGRIIDVSISGAAIASDIRPEIGESIALGKMRARVVRHIGEGFAVEFAAIQNRELLERHITGGMEKNLNG